MTNNERENFGGQTDFWGWLITAFGTAVVGVVTNAIAPDVFKNSIVPWIVICAAACVGVGGAASALSRAGKNGDRKQSSQY
jgi:hypothetical protein